MKQFLAKLEAISAMQLGLKLLFDRRNLHQGSLSRWGYFLHLDGCGSQQMKTILTQVAEPALLQYLHTRVAAEFDRAAV